MSKDIKDVLKKGKELTEAQVEAFLREHPDFLNKHPDLFRILTPPGYDHGDDVVDLQRFMVRRLNDQINQQREVQKDLVKTVRGNFSIQASVHAAVVAMLNCNSFEELIQVVVNDLPTYLQVDTINLCLESDDDPGLANKYPGIQLLPPGMIDYLMGPDKKVLLRDDIIGESYVFGAAASLVQSDVLVRLTVSPHAPPGLLAFGVHKKNSFEDTQGTELLTFLAEVLEACVRQWLHIHHE